jgi:hypothetical protein
MADTMNKNLRGFMQIAPEYVKSKLRRLLGETERMSYEEVLQATTASMREPTP